MNPQENLYKAYDQRSNYQQTSGGAAGGASGANSGRDQKSPGKTQSVGPNLPKFVATKKYVLSGKTLNQIMDAIKMNTPRITQGGGLKIDTRNEEGTFMSVDGTTC